MITQSFRMFIFVIGMFIISGCTTPTVDAGSDKTVQVNQSIQIIGSVSNANGKNVTYIWKEGSTVLANSASFSYTPTIVGDHTLTFYVSDDKGNADNDSMVVTVEEDTPKIETIIIGKTSIELREGNETRLSVTAHYNDNTSKDITSVVEWSIGDATVVSVVNGTLKALKEGNTTLKASYENKTSDEVIITVYKELNGYKLPPEPDPDVNDATLLGVDSNGNGVRDDVERYIITRYAQDPKYHKTKTAIALQYAWASQKILESPTMESKKYIDNALDCESYWIDTKTKHMSGFEYVQYSVEHGVFNESKIKDKIYNTRERIEQKFRFNSALSGNIFNGRKKSIDSCRTNIDEIGE